MDINLPCLHPLQVVQEVLQVLADPQAPEYHLFQLGLEVLFLPRCVLVCDNNTQNDFRHRLQYI